MQDLRNALWEYEKYKVVSRGSNLLLTISQQQSTKTTTRWQNHNIWEINCNKLQSQHMRNILQDPRNALWEYEKYKVVSRGPNLLLTISQQQSTKTTTSLQNHNIWEINLARSEKCTLGIWEIQSSLPWFQSITDNQPTTIN